MRLLPLPSRALYLCKRPLAHCDAAGISFRLRYRNRKQKLNRYAKRTRENLMHCHCAFALSGFEIGQITLSDAGSSCQIRLRHIAPYAQYTDRIFASRQPIDDGLGQHYFGTSLNRGAHLTHYPGRTGILIGNQGSESFIFPLRKDSKFFAVRRLDELHFSHEGLSIVNLSAMPDSRDDDGGVAFDIEDNAPVANAQPCPSTAFEPLHIAMSGLSKNRKLGFNSPAHVGGKPKPLPRDRAGERDLHFAYIAKSDILVKHIIAQCNITRVP
jgi:hypothetical protein